MRICPEYLEYEVYGDELELIYPVIHKLEGIALHAGGMQRWIELKIYLQKNRVKNKKIYKIFDRFVLSLKLITEGGAGA